jgi:transcriptional regulator with XRE-family HTH domain
VNDFSRILKEIRTEKGLSQEKLAEKIGVSVRTLRRWEEGEAFPQLLWHSRIAKALDSKKEALGLVKPTNSKPNDEAKEAVEIQNDSNDEADEVPIPKKSILKSEGVLKLPKLNLRPKWKWGAPLLCLLALLIVLYGLSQLSFFSKGRASVQVTASRIVPQPNASSFESIVHQGVPVPLTFSSSDWDNGAQTSGICSPNTTMNTMAVVTKKGRGIFSCMLHSIVPNNIALQVQVNSPKGAFVGITFRDSKSPLHYYYLYRVNILSGAWDLSKGTGYTQKILSGYGYPQVSKSIAKGSTVMNVLSVVVMNQTIYLYANKQLICQITEKPIYGDGIIGMYTGADPASVIYSNLTIWKLPQNLHIRGNATAY